MKTAERYIRENLGINYPKTAIINASWFEENGLPMIVRCSCCDTSMALPSALISEDGDVYCTNCAGTD